MKIEVIAKDVPNVGKRGAVKEVDDKSAGVLMLLGLVRKYVEKPVERAIEKPIDQHVKARVIRKKKRKKTYKRKDIQKAPIAGIDAEDSTE